MRKMKGINPYDKQLTTADMDKNVHHGAVGGMWEEMGQLQTEFMLSQGLRPDHNLLDIGCGCLRGGIHFIDYLDSGNYFGLDVNNSLIEAGRYELEQAGLTSKEPVLIVDDSFRFEKFKTKFDYMLSISVFTHLSFNLIVRCLSNAKQCLKPNGAYYATYFEAPSCGHIKDVTQKPGNIVSHYDSDPYHHSIEELEFIAKITGLKLQIIGDWAHPRNQKMARFSLA